MPQLRDFLDRFRLAGAPGAAGRAAVPAERQSELAAELLPVLALLEGTDGECARLLAQARGEAERIVAGLVRRQRRTSGMPAAGPLLSVRIPSSG